jgi:hypothetical protein
VSDDPAGQDFRAALKRAARASGLSDEDAERALKRVALRLGGATHAEALAAHPRIQPRRDRDGTIR